MTVEDIVCLLGFVEASFFRKAFKKWTGYTSKEYRERSRLGDKIAGQVGRAAMLAG